MYYLVFYFLCMFYQIHILKQKQLLQSPVSFLLLSIPIIIICYTSLYLGRFSWVLQYIITLSILSILLLLFSHLLFLKKNILSYIHTRYFYIISILIYFYVFTSLNGKNIGTATMINPILSALFVIMMCLFMLLILNSIGSEFKSLILWYDLCSIKLFLTTLCSNLSIYYFTRHTIPSLNITISMLLYSIPVLIPYFIRIYHSIKKGTYSVTFKTTFGLLILLFLLLATTDIIFPNIPLLYYYDIYIHRGIQIGLYASVLLLIPSMKKLPRAIYYHILAIITATICFLLFI